ncbi:MAG: 50S ribosomal protein L35 [Fimbriimonadaceae bacterium]|nr:50S ribosomal protein L35 [Fimbriimonadaceae bacterium]
MTSSIRRRRRRAVWLPARSPTRPTARAEDRETAGRHPCPPVQWCRAARREEGASDVGKTGKTRNAAKKRFKLTGSGKVVRRKGRFAHLLTKKSSTRKRASGRAEEVSPADAPNIRKMITG